MLVPSLQVIQLLHRVPIKCPGSISQAQDPRLELGSFQIAPRHLTVLKTILNSLSQRRLRGNSQMA